MKSTTKSTLFIICLIMSDIFAKVLRVSEEDVGNANDYIDEVLQNLKTNASIVEKFDPLNIPSFNDDGLQISDCVIRGLSNLYRSGDCSVSYNDEIATIVGEIAVKNVKVSTNYAKKVLFFWIKGLIKGSLDHLSIRMTLKIEEGKVRLSELKVINLGDYRAERTTGLSVVLNWLLKIIVNSVAKKSRGKIIDALENKAAEAINDILTKVQMPVLLYSYKT